MRGSQQSCFFCLEEHLTTLMFSIFQGPQGPPGGLGNPGPIGEKVWTLKVFQHISIECAN